MREFPVYSAQLQNLCRILVFLCVGALRIIDVHIMSLSGLCPEIKASKINIKMEKHVFKMMLLFLLEL